MKTEQLTAIQEAKGITICIFNSTRKVAASITINEITAYERARVIANEQITAQGYKTIA